MGDLGGLGVWVLPYPESRGIRYVGNSEVSLPIDIID